MKLLFFSDVHGMSAPLEKLFRHADSLRPDKLVLLGDALYHGPRNGVPDGYSPTRAIDLFNSRACDIIAVRGNCDAEVDQQVLQFPILADFSQIDADGILFFLTHGHRWNEHNLPPLSPGTILAHGHTHIPVIKQIGCGIQIFNPGSISLPKGGNPPTFGFFDGSKLSIRLLSDGTVI